MPQILPTHQCFDDAVEYLAGAYVERPGWSADHLVLVHALCVTPDGPHKGTRFCHAWVEQDGEIAIQAGILSGERVFYGVLVEDLRRFLGVVDERKYTIEAAAGYPNGGPWVPEWRAITEHSDKTLLLEAPLLPAGGKEA